MEQLTLDLNREPNTFQVTVEGKKVPVSWVDIRKDDPWTYLTLCFMDGIVRFELKFSIPGDIPRDFRFTCVTHPAAYSAPVHLTVEAL